MDFRLGCFPNHLAPTHPNAACPLLFITDYYCGPKDLLHQGLVISEVALAPGPRPALPRSFPLASMGLFNLAAFLLALLRPSLPTATTARHETTLHCALDTLTMRPHLEDQSPCASIIFRYR
jgi:hypothetical protein